MNGGEHPRATALHEFLSDRPEKMKDLVGSKVGRKARRDKLVAFIIR